MSQYAYRFRNIWLWNEFPARSDFGGKDTGIDLVALTTEGDYWTIRCKCSGKNSPSNWNAEPRLFDDTVFLLLWRKIF
ncbi:MAG: hypothetical protein HGA97_08745 [Chlorobiaceae bacterium]|nr:hypothetical protein [Chlorobiaceae bacterium]